MTIRWFTLLPSLIFFFALQCFYPSVAHAGAIALSPSQIYLTIVPGEKVTGEFYVQRAFPGEDELMDVSVRGEDVSMVSLDGGEELLLPVGEPAVSYPFSIETSGLEIGNSYQWSISFIKQDTEVAGVGSEVYLGVSGAIQLNVVDELPPEQQAVDLYSEDEPGAYVTLQDIEPSFSEGAGLFDGFIWSFQNVSDTYVKNVPYVYELEREGRVVMSGRGKVIQVVAPGESLEVDVSAFARKSGEYKITVRVGDKEVSTDQRFYYWDLHEWQMSTSQLVLILTGILVLLAFMVARRKKLTLVILLAVLLLAAFGFVLFQSSQTFTLAELGGMSTESAPLALVVTPEGESIFVRLQDGEQQVFNGSWNIFGVSTGRAYAFSNDVETPAGHLVGSAAVASFDLTRLPGIVDAVEENTYRSHVLFEGVDGETEKRFACVAEIVHAYAPDCVMLDSLISTDLSDATFASGDSRLVLFQEGELTWQYDLWTAALTQVNTDQEEFSDEQIKVANVSSDAVLPQVYRVFSYENQLHWIPEGMRVAVLSDRLFLLQKEENEKRHLYLADIDTGAYAFLTTVPSGGDLYTFQKGSFMTSP